MTLVILVVTLGAKGRLLSSFILIYFGISRTMCGGQKSLLQAGSESRASIRSGTRFGKNIIGWLPGKT